MQYSLQWREVLSAVTELPPHFLEECEAGTLPFGCISQLLRPVNNVHIEPQNLGEPLKREQGKLAKPERGLVFGRREGGRGEWC